MITSGGGDVHLCLVTLAVQLVNGGRLPGGRHPPHCHEIFGPQEPRAPRFSRRSQDLLDVGARPRPEALVDGRPITRAGRGDELDDSHLWRRPGQLPRAPRHDRRGQSRESAYDESAREESAPDAPARIRPPVAALASSTGAGRRLFTPSSRFVGRGHPVTVGDARNPRARARQDHRASAALDAAADIARRGQTMDLARDSLHGGCLTRTESGSRSRLRRSPRPNVTELLTTRTCGHIAGRFLATIAGELDWMPNLIRLIPEETS